MKASTSSSLRVREMNCTSISVTPVTALSTTAFFSFSAMIISATWRMHSPVLRDEPPNFSTFSCATSS